MSQIVKIGKMCKKALKKIYSNEKTYVRYTRRINNVKTSDRICAMTFDDGPMDIPASPDRAGGTAMTDILLDSLKEYDAHGTFDLIGDTSGNYPDKTGKEGSATWGGIRFDHYPDFEKDSHGGAVHCDRLVRRILDEGHQITNHGYRHIIFGRKNIIYNNRETLGSFDAVISDLDKMDRYILDNYGYKIEMGRPPHYVDRIGDGFTSYDAYEKLGYQYLGASFDGAGWLPGTSRDPDAALNEEIAAMTEPFIRKLKEDPDFFRGKIIFQKDGYNMSRRTPVAFALAKQLEILKEYGYRVVGVGELMRLNPFADVDDSDPLLSRLIRLAETKGVAFNDNTVRLDKNITNSEMAMLIAPKDQALKIREDTIRKTGKQQRPEYGAVQWCITNGFLAAGVSYDAVPDSLPAEYFGDAGSDMSRRNVIYNMLTDRE